MAPQAAAPVLTVGEVARRSGVSASALRYYEQQQLITSTRTGGNQRRYPRTVLRRLAFVAAAQQIGLSLAQVREMLDQLPADRAPSVEEWTRLGAPWRELVAARIRQLQALQDTLDQCLGCGCLSLARCALFNAQDAAATEGPGSRWLRAAVGGDVVTGKLTGGSERPG